MTTRATSRQQSGGQDAGPSQRAQAALDFLRGFDPILAAKVHHAGQLALFEESAAPDHPKQHVWRYIGHQKSGALYDCSRCAATMRTTRRFEKALVTYSIDGSGFTRERPACAPRVEKERG